MLKNRLRSRPGRFFVPGSFAALALALSACGGSSSGSASSGNAAVTTDPSAGSSSGGATSAPAASPGTATDAGAGAATDLSAYTLDWGGQIEGAQFVEKFNTHVVKANGELTSATTQYSYSGPNGATDTTYSLDLTNFSATFSMNTAGTPAITKTFLTRDGGLQDLAYHGVIAHIMNSLRSSLPDPPTPAQKAQATDAVNTLMLVLGSPRDDGISVPAGVTAPATYTLDWGGQIEGAQSGSSFNTHVVKSANGVTATLTSSGFSVGGGFSSEYTIDLHAMTAEVSDTPSSGSPDSANLDGSPSGADPVQRLQFTGVIYDAAYSLRSALPHESSPAEKAEALDAAAAFEAAGALY